MSTATEIPHAKLTEMIDLGGKTAVVTGAAMGIGRGIAQRLHEAGASLVLADLDGPQAGLLADELNSERPHSALGVHTDVANAGDVETLLNAAVRQYGGVDILVNNAAICPPRAFLEMDPALVERVLRVNLVGPLLTMRAVARQMIQQGHGGSIINITSGDARPTSMTGLAHYDASEPGLWGLTKNAALELAQYDIRVNALAPGGVAIPGTATADDPDAVAARIERIPVHRMADPDEMARIVLFLASDLAAHMVGSHLVAAGGGLLLL